MSSTNAGSTGVCVDALDGTFELLEQVAPAPKPPKPTISWDDPTDGRVTCSVTHTHLSRDDHGGALTGPLIMSRTRISTGDTNLVTAWVTLNAHGYTLTGSELHHMGAAERDAINAALTYPAAAALLTSCSANTPFSTSRDLPPLICALTNLPVDARTVGLALIAAGYTGTPDDLAQVASASTTPPG